MDMEEPKRRKPIALWIAALASAGLVVGIFLRIHSCGNLTCDCTEASPENAISPDSTLIAEKVIELCGGAIGSNSIGVDMARVRGSTTKVFEMELRGDITMKWVDSRTLQIAYPETAEIFSKVEAADGVTIRYVSAE